MNETACRASERILTNLLGILDFHKSVAYRSKPPRTQVVNEQLCFDTWSGASFEMPALISVQLSLVDGSLTFTQPGLEFDTTHSDFLAQYVERRRGKSMFELAQISKGSDVPADRLVEHFFLQDISPDVFVQRLFHHG